MLQCLGGCLALTSITCRCLSLVPRPCSSHPAMAIRVFVYGTLKRGGRNYYLMRGDQGGVAKLLAEGRLARPHPMIVDDNRRCPFVLPREGSGKVRTEHHSR